MMMTPNNSLLGNKTDFEEIGGAFTIRVAVLGALGILFALGFSFSLFSFFKTDIPNYLWLSIVCLGFFLITFLLDTLFIKGKTLLSGIVFLESIALISAFFNQFSIVFIVGMLATFLLLIWASVSGQHEAQERLKIRFFIIAGVVFGRLITALAIMITTIYISSSQFQESLISKERFSKIILTMNPVVERVVPGVSLTHTLDEAAKIFAIRKIEESTELRAIELPQEARIIYVEETTKSLERQLSRSLNVRITRGDTLIDILYAGLTENASRPTNAIFFLVAGILIFLALKSFGIVFGIVLQPLAFLIYQTLIALGFARIALETKSKEVIIV